LIHNAVGERIGEGDAQLEDIGAAFSRARASAPGLREIRVAGADVVMRPLRPAARSSANFSSMRLGMGRRILRGAGWFDSENSCTTVRPRMSEAKPATLVVNEIYQSIQGESSWAGLPVRLRAADGVRSSLQLLRHGVRLLRRERSSRSRKVIASTLAFDCPMVELTGGEPLPAERTPCR
jgi:hypothetical protein